MQTRSQRGSEPGEVTQDVQHASAQEGIVPACTSDGERGGDSEAQGQEGGTRGEGWCEGGSGGARVVANSPGAGRAPPHGPAVELAVASQTSSQTGDETILRDGNGVCQERGRRRYGFRRLRSAVGGVLRTTREAADAAVRQAKRLFFRDAG